MKLKLKKLVTACLVTTVALSSMVTQTFAYTDYMEAANGTYVYNQNGFDVAIPDAYEYKSSISLKTLDINGELAEGETALSVTSPNDMFVAFNEDLYVTDSEAGIIICFDSNLKYKGIIKEFKRTENTAFLGKTGKADIESEITKLKTPGGIFVTEDKDYYIADTGNNRVLVADKDFNVLMEIYMPEDLLGTTLNSFLPTKVVVDSVGRISVVAKNINNGIMQFSTEGFFTGYTGAPKVHVDAFTKFLRKFSTAEQRAQMLQYVPTEYNNIKIDEKNFIWGTISSLSTSSISTAVANKDLSGSTTPIRKLNTGGTDVLRRKGIYAPLGDLNFIDAPSKITDVGLGPNNIYTMLDTTRGKLFTYNNDGVLLYAFGGKGNRKGDVQTPVAIDYIGDKILVLDSALCEIIIYEPTYYGQLLIEAEGYYMNGDYENAYGRWADVAELNSNFEYAYVGLGNARYSVQNYEEAMDYYEYADNTTGYSKAKEGLRKQSSEKAFPVIFTTIIAVVILTLVYVAIKKFKVYASGEFDVLRAPSEDE